MASAPHHENKYVQNFLGILATDVSTDKRTVRANGAPRGPKFGGIDISLSGKDEGYPSFETDFIWGFSFELKKDMTVEKRLQRIAELRQQVAVGTLAEDFLRMPSTSGTALASTPLDPATQFYSFIPPNTRGRLVLKIVEAKLTKNYGLVRMDPYIRLRVGNAVFETHTCVNGGKTPVWNRVINAYLPIGVESVYVQIFDERSFTQDECIAWAHIILPDGVFGQETVDEWYSLSGPQGEGKEGVLNILASFTPVVAQEAQTEVTRREPNSNSEQDVANIKEMFPEVDVEVIKTLMESNNNNRDATVNALIEINNS